MQSNLKDVGACVQQAPEDRREALSKLRETCLGTLKQFDETMAYGMPSYERKGTVEVAFASQKNYIALYILRQDALATQRESLAGSSAGKGCIRYRKPDHIDFGVVKKLLVATRKSKGPVC